MTSSSAERCLNFILLVLLKKATTLVDRSPEDIKHACEKACVVPDVLPFAPRDIVKVKYFHGFIANLGNKLITNDVHIPPNIMDWPTKNNTYYTIVFVGPDEPSAAAASKSQIIYWLKSNIYEQRYMETGDTIVEYTTPEPLKGTSWHRYVYVVYEQPHGNMTIHMEIINSNSSSDPARAKFSAQAFAMKHKLGDALAVNFFIFEWREDFFEPLSLTPEDTTRSNGSECAFVMKAVPRTTTTTARPTLFSRTYIV
ncbi:unnamed protein product [Bemisia tabaci]|uniref:Phosphatidylethanolamine-binding protein n=1 Tax=Bemisia tabaci TaxID=7038 RepID=A0A9N9ZWH7_BEMTA|nr:PREDICTED: protein D1-like [Bemisia tabaci]XP_018910672.1 PREDICTED: protein D1-like [Bemisia tabaci]XP_018910693.1 PREDICTED: protein D1-like [Bemisia tabaci]XP_018910701.1 PREDICTED: protein D1-like [Bemisia tabaci]XP_018910710.1 PREDICTED: protein D1-like [Bemisia tabaci]XP_018910717.1 PREDICTED: protein D1-like [Bemisia tabaci]XP_018910725.1 PREDICTED: protein D1-like [Bemisia tabaci]XP_018910734.1 PREDICTED: protein D1-like [Bemisia tabaci]CAH0380796.1 unnamed protein product [Bemis